MPLPAPTEPPAAAGWSLTSRLAWRFGVGVAITDPAIKLAELRNWLDKQVLK